MAQLFFKYGTMNSGKSTEILKVAHTYKTQGKKAYLMTSRIDTRTGVGRISSRIGLEEEAQTIGEGSNVYDIVAAALDKEEDNGRGIDVVLVDETQFLNREHIIQLAQVVDNLDLPVLCFGLKNDFSNRLFEGSEALLIYADKIEEIKNVCQYCNKKATMNIRLVDGEPVYEGEQIQVGGNESYQSVCRKCYNHPRK